MNDAFWCITLSILLLSWYINKNRTPKDKTIVEEEPIGHRKREIEKQNELYRKELEKKGYSDELIAVILPTINDGQ